MSRRQRRYDQQTNREVHRAELLVAEVQNTSTARAAKTLREDAAATGVSVHAAALAALAAGGWYTYTTPSAAGPSRLPTGPDPS